MGSPNCPEHTRRSCTIPTGAAIVGVADFNGDRQNDLLLSYASTRKTTVYYLNGPNKTGEAAGPTLTTGWALKEVADMDGDGRPDLIDYMPRTGGRPRCVTSVASVVTGTAAGSGIARGLPAGGSVT